MVNPHGGPKLLWASNVLTCSGPLWVSYGQCTVALPTENPNWEPQVAKILHTHMCQPTGGPCVFCDIFVTSYKMSESYYNTK